jgi:hypothetical protein
MPTFKYIVANKEGKKLSGTIEVPDQETARTELNNLGFSILELETIEDLTKQEEIEPERFVFEALDKHSKFITGTIPGKNKDETFRKLTKEYDLSVTAIWEEGATEQEINKSKVEGTRKFQEALLKEEEASKNAERVKTLEEEKAEQFTKEKIEHLLQNVNTLLKEFDQEFDKAQKAEINKKINKILRIKNSSNLNYIVTSAEELLSFLKEQEKTLREKGFNDKQLELSIKTREMLDELKKTNKPKTISDDIIKKIETWEEKHKYNNTRLIKFIKKLLEKIKEFFSTPPEIQNLKDQISGYNEQLIQFIKLYFKESTPEYKLKIKESIKTIWAERKRTKAEIARIKKEMKAKNRLSQELIGEPFSQSLVKEINSLTGWLLAFYIIYYFIALYITTKNFGLSNIPKNITVYQSHTFKYILAIIFLLHATTSLKVNFFKKSVIADIILIPVFLITSTIALLNL